MKKSVIAIGAALSVLIIVAACGRKSSAPVATGKTIKSIPVGNLTATLSSESGTLKHGEQEVFLSFTDASNKPVDVGAASLTLHMDQMGTMAAMNDTAALTTTSTPGVYRGKVEIEVAGEWQAQLAYEGAAGKGKTTFSVTAQ